MSILRRDIPSQREKKKGTDGYARLLATKLYGTGL